MAFPAEVAEKALLDCGRHCCICHKFCGFKIELHHIKQVAEGGKDTYDNCIPLCFDCHAEVKAYDPKAYPKFKPLTDLPIEYMDRWEDALQNADFAVIQADWQEIRDIKPGDFKRLLKNPIVIDGRRSYNPKELIKHGIIYRGIGWKNQDE